MNIGERIVTKHKLNSIVFEKILTIANEQVEETDRLECKS